jgi:short-subunit dehydrogenase
MPAMARTIDVNLTGVVRTVSATLPHVTAARGYYLLVSSASALAPVAGLATYAATKIGVEHFGSSLRLELAQQGVGVGVAHPCWIDTEMVRGPQHDLESFNEMLRVLPGPFGKVTTVTECAAALVDAVEGRRRKVYVPRSLGRFALLRQFFGSPVAEWVMGRHVRRILPKMEREVAALGRSFGAHSVGLGAGQRGEATRP